MNVWESIFAQSPANNGFYNGDKLPQQNWDWPKGTWFQARLERIREREPVLKLQSLRKPRRVSDLEIS